MKGGELPPPLWRALADAGGHERQSTGRRILVLTAIFHLLRSSSAGSPGRDIRNRSVHSTSLAELRNVLTEGALIIEQRFDALSGIMVSPLLDDALHAGAALFQHVAAASAVYEGLADTSPESFGAWFDVALDEIAQGPAMGEVATSRPLAKLVRELAKVQSGCSLLDPAAGMGTLLSLSADTGADLFGQEINLVNYALARLRLHLKRKRARIELGDSLTDPATFGGPPAPTFDRIVCDPPMGAAREMLHRTGGSGDFEFPSPRLETLFVQHCLRSLNPDGRAVILVGQGLLVRRGAEAYLRGALVARGSLEGVIALPAGVVPWAGIPFAIIILRGRRLAEQSSEVTFVDAADLAIDAKRGGERLSDDIIARIVASYDRGTESTFSKCTTEVAPDRAAANLLPSTFVPRPEAERADLAALVAELEDEEGRARSAAEKLDRLYTFFKLRG